MAITERLLHSVGKQTFVKCFEFFRENYNKLNRYEMAKIMPSYNPMLQTNDDDTSVPRIASFAIQIFKENKEIEARPWRFVQMQPIYQMQSLKRQKVF